MVCVCVCVCVRDRESERDSVLFLCSLSSLVLDAFLLGCFCVCDACRDFVQYLGSFKLLTVTNFTETNTFCNGCSHYAKIL